MMNRAAVLGGMVVALAGAGSASAQQPAPTVTIVPGPQYATSGLGRLVLGSNWRELWTTPLRVPVLDLRTFAGGLTPERRGGGNQSITLHMVDASGRGWIFRSIDKYPADALPDEFRGAPLGAAVADQVSSLHPAGHLVMPKLLDAVGVLHPNPALYVMPDDPRLGEFRETFAGMLGELEEKPDEGPDDTPGFAGSRKVKGSDNFLDDLEDSPEYRLDEHEFLRARLVDFMVGDPDRGTDQWRWARFGEEGDYVYRPVPRDRDWAFMRASGPLPAIMAGTIYPKIVEFDEDFGDIAAHTYASHVLDRRLLTRLTRADFLEQAAAVQAALTDEVIAAAVSDMPPEYHPLVAGRMTQHLRARRALLPEMALRFYDWLAGEVDVRGTDERDVATIEHLEDGRLRVRLASEEAPALNGAAGPGVYFERTFLPSETREVRVHLHGAADRAVVSGTRSGPITVRVIGGGGDDVLEDRTGRARFYDHRGDNRFITVPGTRVDTKAWDPPPAPEGLRTGSHWAPDWGASRSLFNPALDHTDAGLIVGVGPSYRRYGFRRLPYKWEARAKALYAPAVGGFGIAAEADYRFLNSRRALTLDARATQFDVFRFYGFGNDTPEFEAADTRVLLDRVFVNPALAWHLGKRPGEPGALPEPDEEEEAGDENEDDVQRPFTHRRLGGPRGIIAIGPLLQWTRMRPPAANWLAAAEDRSFGQVGALALFTLRYGDRETAPRRGYRLHAEARAFAPVWDATDAFGRVGAEATGYLPLVGETHLAVRIGAEQTLGSGIPPFESARIGGRHSLRGYRSDRFAGETATYGGAELRVPLGTLRLIVNGELGAFGLADAGRVWVDDASPGGWHTGFGGGLWFAAFDRGFSMAYAHGERGRFYLWSGLPF